MMLRALLALAWIPLLHGQTAPASASDSGALSKRLSRAMLRSPLFARSSLGLHVVELSTGKTLFARNIDRMFVPASNTKLVTTAAALAKLGTDYRFKTQLIQDESGNLVLFGGGDPSMSGRAYPYQKDSDSLNPLHALEELVDQAVAKGLDHIDGDVIGDDTLYPWDPYPESWTTSDSLSEYGAPVSALTLGDNVISIHVRPGARLGDLAELEVEPGFEYFAIDNRIQTAGRGMSRVRYTRRPGSNQLLLTGSIGFGGERTVTLPVDDPAMFAAQALYDVLTRRGIAIRGQAIVRHRDQEEPLSIPSGKLLAERVSPALPEILQMMEKVSQNLHAELILREVGRVGRNEGTFEAGIQELSATLERMGATPDDFRFEDGSGLSRNDLVTPRVLTRLLASMYEAKDGDTSRRNVWMSLLPVGGEDGTLSNRLCCVSDAHNIHAKTGSLARSIALSGYAESKTYGMLAFSIIVNNFAAGGNTVRSWVDKMALELVE